MSETDEVAIKVENLSKSFRLPHEKTNSVKGALINFARHKRGYEEQHVLKKISFEIKKGEFFGVVGRNGSGKSTLLKLLAGIYMPNGGGVHVNGKITPFIELGVGFNPELTGRENVFLNGALLGFSRKEMQAMYHDIVEFAELERFMDQKLKNYSSGMQVRLAFSIAIRAQGDILILDEVLAVGDAKFQEKCFDFFDKVKGSQTVVFVSHDMKAIKRYCDRALVLENGKIIDIGAAEEMALRYSTIMANEELKVLQTSSGKGVHVGSGDARITDVEIINSQSTPHASLAVRPGEPFTVRIHFTAKKTVKHPGLLVSIFAQHGTKLFSATTLTDHITVPELKGKGHIDFDIKENPFAPGVYKLNVGIFDEKIFHAYDHFRDALDFTVRGEREGDSNLSLKTKWEIIQK